MDDQLNYNFDIDLMKRAMDPPVYEFSKKPRYSSSALSMTATPMAAPKTAPLSTSPSFENYGYGGNGPNLYGNGMHATSPTGGLPSSAPAYSNGSAMMNMSPLNMGMGMSVGMSPMMGMAGVGMPNMFSMGLNSMGGGMSGFPYSPLVGSFPQTPASAAFNLNGMGGGLSSPALSTFSAANGYSGAVAAAAAAASNNATGRTVYIGSLPPTASVDELLNLVHFGPIENIRVLPSKSCVFISFLDGATAAAFHADATIRKLTLHGQELKIGWGKASPVPSPVLMAISQSGASRNVYLGGLDEGTTEEQLRDDLSRFGLIDQVKIVRDKGIGFVHFLSIATATKVVATLPTEPAWAGKRVNYGKDRCAYIPKSQQAAAAAAQVAAAQSLVATGGLMGTNPTATFGDIGNPANPSAANLSVMAQAAAGTSLNRTVYLGNIHPETTTEDLCNAIRGGVLQSIRYIPDKHIAFVTFVDPAASIAFFNTASIMGLSINGRRVKVGWGKNSGPLPREIALAVHGGATRNVYVGNIGETEWESFSEARLRVDFEAYGEVELVNYLKEKNCAFVNFTNIANAIKAIEAIKLLPEYSTLRISHGKDRCANPPRMPTVGGGGNRRPRDNADGGGGSAPNSAGLVGMGLGLGMGAVEEEPFGEEGYDDLNAEDGEEVLDA